MLKKLFFGCSLLIVLAAVGVFIVWRQATRLPDWYTASTAEGWYTEPRTQARDESLEVAPEERAPPLAPRLPAADLAPAATAPRPDPMAGAPADTSASRRRIAEAPSPPRPAIPPGPGRVELDEARLNELLLRGLDEHPRSRRLKRAVKAVHASIDGGRLELGVVTNLDDLAAATENDREAAAVQRLRRLAPWLGRQDFYLAARGTPGVRNGNLYFGRGVDLKIGGITFDAADLATRLGVPQEQIDRGLEVPIAGMRLEDVEVGDASLVLSLAGE